LIEKNDKLGAPKVKAIVGKATKVLKSTVYAVAQIFFTLGVL